MKLYFLPGHLIITLLSVCGTASAKGTGDPPVKTVIVLLQQNCCMGQKIQFHKQENTNKLKIVAYSITIPGRIQAYIISQDSRRNQVELTKSKSVL